MSAVHNPQEKKRLAYERDHYSKSKHDKARNAWRTKKHKARRSYRHAVDSLAKAAALEAESDSKIRCRRDGAPLRGGMAETTIFAVARENLWHAVAVLALCTFSIPTIQAQCFGVQNPRIRQGGI